MDGGESVSSEYGAMATITGFSDGARLRCVYERSFNRIDPEGRRTNCRDRSRQGWRREEEGGSQP